MSRSRVLVFALTVLCAALCVRAQTGGTTEAQAMQPKAPTAAELAKVTDILATVKANDTASQQSAEDQLLKDTATATLSTALTTRNATLTQAMADPARAQEATLLRAQIDVLDTAIIRQSWNLNPNLLLRDWLANLPYTWSGRAERITDEQVARTFPNVLFTAR